MDKRAGERANGRAGVWEATIVLRACVVYVRVTRACGCAGGWAGQTLCFI